MSRTALYRHFDADNRLLYVGITCDLSSRNAAHERGAEWFPQVSTTTVQWLDDRDHAAALEAVAIRFEAPKHNRDFQPSERRIDRAAPSPARSIIEKWTCRRDLADDLGVDIFTVHKWHRRDAIPAKYDMGMIAAATARGIKLSLADLATTRIFGVAAE